MEKLAAVRTTGDFADVKALSRDLAFNASGHVLHCLFWHSMTPGGSQPDGALAKALDDSFGSVEAFTRYFAAATKAVEASGWGVLVYEPVAGKLVVLQCEKHQNLTVWGVRAPAGLRRVGARLLSPVRQRPFRLGGWLHEAGQLALRRPTPCRRPKGIQIGRRYTEQTGVPQRGQREQPMWSSSRWWQWGQGVAAGPVAMGWPARQPSR